MLATMSHSSGNLEEKNTFNTMYICTCTKYKQMKPDKNSKYLYVILLTNILTHLKLYVHDDKMGKHYFSAKLHHSMI